MKNTLTFLLSVWFMSGWAQPQTKNERIVHNDPTKYKELSAVHTGAGKMGFTQLVGRNDLATNFLYLHAGVIQPKSGIGHHFHHSIEEMYVLLNGEAEFTVNGRTSKLKAPAIVPCKLGDAFDLGDARVGATLDKIPVFVSYQLKRDGLKDVNHPYAGNGALSRRAFGSEVFSTNWNHVDHVVVPAGKSVGPRQLEGIEEVYYVVKGTGNLTVGGSTKPIVADDAFTGSLGETLAITNTGSGDLELLVIGIAASSNKDPNRLKPLTKPKAIVLQMDFTVPKENAEAFEKMYYSIYVPAMTVQTGYVGSKLLRLFPDEVAKTIQAEPTLYNYQIQISFDTEENRRKWVASPQHQIAWPAAESLAKEYKWRGYDVMGDDGH